MWQWIWVCHPGQHVWANKCPQRCAIPSSAQSQTDEAQQ